MPGFNFPPPSCLHLTCEKCKEDAYKANPRIHTFVFFTPSLPFLLPSLCAVLLKTLGLEGSFTVLPSMMFISFGVAISSNSETHILRVGGGLDVYKLRRVNHLGKKEGTERWERENANKLEGSCSFIIIFF